MNILIIDDDPMIRKALSHHLLENSHTVSIATNGREAIQIIENYKDIDLIICDVMMPVLTGASFILMLKNYFPDELPRVIVISGVKIDEQFLNKIDVPYDYFMPKPIDFKKLTEVIDSMETAKN